MSSPDLLGAPGFIPFVLGFGRRDLRPSNDGRNTMDNQELRTIWVQNGRKMIDVVPKTCRSKYISYTSYTPNGLKIINQNTFFSNRSGNFHASQLSKKPSAAKDNLGWFPSCRQTAKKGANLWWLSLLCIYVHVYVYIYSLIKDSWDLMISNSLAKWSEI